MRWLWSIGIVVLLAGCTQEPASEAQDHDGLAAQEDASAPSSSVATNATTSSNTAGSATGNSTSNQTSVLPGNETGNQTGNQTENASAPPIVIVHQQTFSGTVPVDGLQPEHSFPVPEGAVRVEVTYISEHIGLFTALATVSDSGGERITSSDACGFGTPGQATDTCLMVVDEDVGAGQWTVGLTWQVGQATENYTFHVVVFGVATA